MPSILGISAGSKKQLAPSSNDGLDGKRRNRSRSPSAFLKKKGKSFRGILSVGSKSKKKKKKIKEQLESANNASRNIGNVASSKNGVNNELEDQSVSVAQGFDDESTVYNVMVESNPSKHNMLARENPTEEDSASIDPSIKLAWSRDEDSIHKVKVILILIEHTSRRFELLQMEFEPSRARVQDILTQIPASVTEDVLRSQQYIGVCNVNGEDMKNETYLREIVDTNKGNIVEVAIGIPKGSNAKECAKFVIPLMKDPEVVKLFNPNNVVRGEKEMLKVVSTRERSTPAISTKTSPNDAPKVTRKPGEETRNTAPREVAKTEPRTSIGTWLIIFMIASIFPLVTFHNALLKRLQPGDTLVVGEWKSKCGILRYIPSEYGLNGGCEEETLVLEEGGILTLYQGGNVGDTFIGKLKGKEEQKNIILWQMLPNTRSQNADEALATRLKVEDYGGNVSFGGEVLQLKLFGISEADDLSLWPFAPDPEAKAEL